MYNEQKLCLYLIVYIYNKLIKKFGLELGD